MKRYNVILLADAIGEKVLMCRRMKPPYQGLLNLIGGKVEPGEDGLHAAYRELREESGVTAADASLGHLMTFIYPGGTDVELQVYAGRLRREVPLTEETSPLCWMGLDEDFFDMTRFAGEGNIGHMIETLRRYRPEMLDKQALTVTLTPLSEDALPVIAYYHGCPPEKLQPMLTESAAKQHEGRYYEQFEIRVNDCVAGIASLYAQEEGVVSDGIEIFPPFCSCGFASHAMRLLAAAAWKRGCTAMTAQVRTDNAASIALHRRCGYDIRNTCVNRRGHEVYEMLKPLTKQMPVRHEMSLRPKPFAAIASGSKTYELRLNDEKRRRIHVGDEIIFTQTDSDTSIHVRVTSLHPFQDFSALYAHMPLLKCGYTPENVHRADPKDMEAYYSADKQAQSGVLAIGIERIRYPLGMLEGEYEVRALTAEDIPEMLRIAQGNPLYYEHMRMLPTAENLSETLTALPPRRTLVDKHFFGWFRDGRMIALMDLIAHHPKADMAFIGWFMIDATEQGRGLGRRLVGDVLTMLSEEGVQEVRLGRIVGNPQSERFWRACGFEDNGLGYDTDGYSVTVMAKKLV